MNKIIHIDMDAFFASVEQRDCSAYQGKPLIVGGDPKGRGVVAAASYEARHFGIRSAMSCREAYQRCPDAIFVRPRFEVYRAVSQEIHAIFSDYTSLIEPLSLDEAYLDVTHCPQHHNSATLIANDIRQKIWQELKLTASAGVSFNKMLAKIASDLNKPNGIAVITPQDAPTFIDRLPIEKFFGIGKATAQRMHELGIYTGFDLKHSDINLLKQHFGKRGQFYYDIAHLHDPREVKPVRIRKSIGSETTFVENIHDNHTLLTAIQEQNIHAFKAMAQKNMSAITVTLKVKYSDFSQITRSQSVKSAFTSDQDSFLVLTHLFTLIPRHLPLRLVGVSFSNLHPKDDICQQLGLFDERSD